MVRNSAFRSCCLALLVALVAANSAARAQGAAASGAPPDPQLFAQLQWRMIGPFRGGRTVAAVGVPGHPNLFYMGVNNGGVWKTDDAGRTWRSLFDAQPTQSIGALAVAPSNPSVIYAGSGEGLQRPDLSVGDGVYRSDDGGETWRHLGLRDGQQIASLVVDPRDPRRVFAAVLGHPYGANAERGVFRSADGGESWEKVLYKDENTGAVDLVMDPGDPQVLYAALWAARQAPWEIGGSFQVPGSGLFKSTDGGTTWKPLTGGLPGAAEHLGRIDVAVAASQPQRLYAQVDADAAHGGTYRSDDGGATWRRVNNEGRTWGRGGDFAEVEVDPKNPDVIYVCNTSTYKSTDGGRNFTAIKGAPGGDDYHRLWIDPDHPEVLLLAADQGAAVSLNGGRTWSSWYNQPTAQFYHVITDNRFPYWVYGGQQESGSAAVASRGNDGAVTFREFHPVGAEEYGYIAPDPLHPDIIYGGKVERFDWSTGEVQSVAPEAMRTGKIRYVRTLPLLFSPVDPHILYFGASVLFKTTNGGYSWQTISPDLTREKPGVPAVLGAFAADDPEKGAHRGVIYTIAPSFQSVDQLWVGTDDGLIQLTRDGGQHWQDVTPPALTPWSKVSVMEASHFDPAEAYAAVNRFRLDDLRPHIYRTRDYGKTWDEITQGIPAGEVVNAVHEDPLRRGLLYAATERGVHVSFDDGEHWLSLRLNLPASAVRDLTVHGDDLVVGTHGRSFWILDDISALRQIDGRLAAWWQAPGAGAAAAHLFKPATAWRVRRDLYTDTPLPPEEPAGRNPPDGAAIDYLLRRAPHGPVVIEIEDAAGHLVRRYSSADPLRAVDGKELDVPTYWVRPPQVLPAGAGPHRFVWDLRQAPPPVLRTAYPIAAIVHDTPAEPLGALVPAGEYQVKLIVDGQTLAAPFTVKMDPRIRTSAADLQRIYTLASGLCADIAADAAALRQVKSVQEQIQKLPAAAREGDLGKSVAAVDAAAGRLAGNGGGQPNFAALNGGLSQVLRLIDGTDEPPTEQGVAAVDAAHRRLATLLASWDSLRQGELAALNQQLAAHHLPVINPAAAGREEGPSIGEDEDEP